jgi:hypothetical protein
MAVGDTTRHARRMKSFLSVRHGEISASINPVMCGDAACETEPIPPAFDDLAKC